MVYKFNCSDYNSKIEFEPSIEDNVMLITMTDKNTREKISVEVDSDDIKDLVELFENILNKMKNE